MNKILVEDIKNQDLCLKEDTLLILDNYKDSLNISILDNINVFMLITHSDIKVNYTTTFSTSLNIFTVDSSMCLDIDLHKDLIDFKYNYSTINSNDNSYEININHLGNNITSKIINHGINTSNNKLSFVINTIVPKDIVNIKTSQDSKIIILKDNNCTIKPNLLIDNDDIEANHAAYIGKFKEEELFYLMSRGISIDDATYLLVKSFLLSNMSLNDELNDMILEYINKYWR